MPDPIDQTAQQVPPPARRPSFAERLKPQRIDLEDVPEPPALPVEEEESPEREQGSAEMPTEEYPKAETVPTVNKTPVRAAAPDVPDAVPSAPAAATAPSDPAIPATAPAEPASAQGAGKVPKAAAPDVSPDFELDPDFALDPDFEAEAPSSASPRKADPGLPEDLLPKLPGAQPNPFALRPPKVEAGLEAKIFEIAKDGQLLPVGDFETAEELKSSEVTRLINPMMNSISSGDDLHIPARPIKTLEEDLADLGFPPRPHLWPPMMSWPPRRDMELLQKKGLTRETLDEYLRAQQARQLRMLERCGVIDEWLDKYAPDPGFSYRTLDKWRRNQTYRGIQWAALLDEDAAKDSVVSNVISWGRVRVKTRDGGQARAYKDHVAVDKITEQSLTLAIFEARARGWNTLRISGGAEFTKQAMLVCRKYNIAAEVTMRIGPYHKTYHVAPSLPGPVQVDPDPRADFDQGMPEQSSLPAPARSGGDGKRRAIPDSGVNGQPKSPFASGSTDMGRDIDDPEEPAQAEVPVAERLAFGDPLEAPGERKKENATVSRDLRQEKEDPLIDV